MNTIKSIKTTSALLITGLVLNACSTVHFVQYEQPGEQKSQSKWHHMALNGMVELSSPLDIRSLCGNKAWNKITTEYTFYNWAAGAIVPSIPFVITYTPYTNKVECFEAVKPPLKPKQPEA